MPIYEYRCSECGNIFERFESIQNYQRSLECPVCGAKAHLIISGGNGLIFKGSGFYITDYKRNGNNNTSDSSAKNSQTQKTDS